MTKTAAHTEALITRAVSKGANEQTARTLLTELLTAHAGSNLAVALVYNGFATEKQALSFVAA